MLYLVPKAPLFRLLLLALIVAAAPGRAMTGAFGPASTIPAASGEMPVRAGWREEVIFGELPRGEASFLRYEAGTRAVAGPGAGPVPQPGASRSALDGAAIHRAGSTAP